MYKYLLSAKHGLKTAEETLHTSLHRIHNKVLWALGAFALVLIPSAAFAWQQHDSSVSPATFTPQPEITEKPSQPSLPENSSVPEKAVINESSKINVSTNSENQGSAHETNSMNTELHVNGRSVPLPKNGSVHKEIHDENGDSTVDISVSSQSSGTSQSHSSMNIELNSRAESNSDTPK